MVESFKDDYKLQKYQQGFIKCSKSISQSSIGTKKEEKLVKLIFLCHFNLTRLSNKPGLSVSIDILLHVAFSQKCNLFFLSGAYNETILEIVFVCSPTKMSLHVKIPIPLLSKSCFKVSAGDGWVVLIMSNIQHALLLGKVRLGFWLLQLRIKHNNSIWLNMLARTELGNNRISSLHALHRV